MSGHVKCSQTVVRYWTWGVVEVGPVWPWSHLRRPLLASTRSSPCLIVLLKLRPPEEWRQTLTLEDALKHVPPGQDVTLRDPSLVKS